MSKRRFSPKLLGYNFLEGKKIFF